MKYFKKKEIFEVIITINFLNILKMSFPKIECPICMDYIDVIKNCVTTECGHFFHSSCLMKNVAHNGFNCPYCRAAMAEHIEKDDTEDDETISDWSEYEDEDEDEEMFDDYALRGFRFFMNNIEGIEHETEDTNEEGDGGQPTIVERIKPSLEFITEKLVEQGITMKHLIKILLIDHEEYDSNEIEFSNIDDDVYGKLRIIISNYRPEEMIIQEEPLVEQHIDNSSQPKEYANITVRRQMNI